MSLKRYMVAARLGTLAGVGLTPEDIEAIEAPAVVIGDHIAFHVRQIGWTETGKKSIRIEVFSSQNEDCGGES